MTYIFSTLVILFHENFVLSGYNNILYFKDTKNWKFLKCDGNNPPPRANHSSSVLNNNLYIFGGWDGSKRLNDLYILDSGNFFE